MQGMIWSRARQTLRSVSAGGIWSVAALGLILSASALIAPARASVLQVGQTVVSDGITFAVVSCTFGGTACNGTQANFVSSGGGAPGITITGSSGSLVSDPGTNHDLAVEFSASGTGINGVSLGIAGATAGNGTAGTGETVFTSDGTTSLGSLSVTVGGTTADTIAFAAQSLVYLSKDITSFAYGGAGNSASVTSVTQTLSIASVPEPASVGLFLFGLLALAGFRSTAVQSMFRSARRQGSAIG